MQILPPSLSNLLSSTPDKEWKKALSDNWLDRNELQKIDDLLAGVKTVQMVKQHQVSFLKGSPTLVTQTKAKQWIQELSGKLKTLPKNQPAKIQEMKRDIALLNEILTIKQTSDRLFSYQNQALLQSAGPARAIAPKTADELTKAAIAVHQILAKAAATVKPTTPPQGKAVPSQSLYTTTTNKISTTMDTLKVLAPSNKSLMTGALTVSAVAATATAVTCVVILKKNAKVVGSTTKGSKPYTFNPQQGHASDFAKTQPSGAGAPRGTYTRREPKVNYQKKGGAQWDTWESWKAKQSGTNQTHSQQTNSQQKAHQSQQTFKKNTMHQSKSSLPYDLQIYLYKLMGGNVSDKFKALIMKGLNGSANTTELQQLSGHVHLYKMGVTESEVLSFYKAAEISSTANVDEINKAYRSLTKLLHPDMEKNLSGPKKILAEALKKWLQSKSGQTPFIRLQGISEVLKDGLGKGFRFDSIVH